MIQNFDFVLLGATFALVLVALVRVAILASRLARFVTAWSKYQGNHETRLGAVESRLSMGFWSPEKTGGQNAARLVKGGGQ